MRHLFPCLLVALLALTSLAQAQDDGMVKLETADDSRGWDAVGKLVLGKRGFCTGALIGPQLVLTAAHCLYDKTTGVQIRPEDIEFQAGFRNGRAVAYRRVSRAVTHPDYHSPPKTGWTVSPMTLPFWNSASRSACPRWNRSRPGPPRWKATRLTSSPMPNTERKPRRSRRPAKCLPVSAMR